MAVIFNELGERIPIWNTYIGGGLLLTFFGVAILRQFELIPQAGLDAINSFISDDANFLTFFIVMLIVGSVLGLEKDILLKSFAGYVPAILGGLACAAILGGITGAGAKCTIVIAPIMQGRIPSICSEVTTVTTPGEDVDVVVTDYGIAINPKRTDLIEATKDTGLPIKTIEELRDIAYAIVGTPDKVQFGDRVVGIIEAHDGTIMDVVRAVKEYEFAD